MNIKIPKTIEEATDALGGIGQLLTAKSWERAAIVYAFTDPVIGDQPSVSAREHRMSIKAFTEIGIAGLRSRSAVTAYRKAWANAILDRQAVPVEPGDTVELPAREFPDTMTGTTHSGATNVVAAVKRNPQVIKEIVQADPEAFEAVAEAVSQHPGLTHRATEKVEARRQTREPKPAGPKYWDEATTEVIRELEAAMVRVHALVENRAQLDEFELRRLTESLSANTDNLMQYVIDLRATQRLAFGEQKVGELA